MHQNIRFFSTAALCLCSLAANADVKTFNGERNAGESIVVAESPEITFATWVKIDGWGKGDKPYPRIIDGPAFYFHPTQGSDGLAGLTLGVRLPDGVEQGAAVEARRVLCAPEIRLDLREIQPVRGTQKHGVALDAQLDTALHIDAAAQEAPALQRDAPAAVA